MNVRQLILAMAAGLIILVFFNIPVYKAWKANRLETTWANFDEDLDHLSLEDRRLKRWGNPYQLALFIRQQMDRIHADTNGVLLVPPADIMKKHITEALPEPIVTYYFSGIRTVSPENTDFGKAAYALLLKGGDMMIIKIKSPAMLSEVLDQYKTY